jgi:hypothetical protein
MSKVSHLPAVEAWKIVGGKLLWRPDGSLLWWWSRSPVELLLLLVLWAVAPILLLLELMQRTPRWGIHHVILRRSTTKIITDRGCRHYSLPLLLIGLNNGLY